MGGFYFRDLRNCRWKQITSHGIPKAGIETFGTLGIGLIYPCNPRVALLQHSALDSDLHTLRGFGSSKSHGNPVWSCWKESVVRGLDPFSLAAAAAAGRGISLCCWIVATPSLGGVRSAQRGPAVGLPALAEARRVLL